MKILAFDESGNTGADLLDKRQPVFVLASVYLSKSQAGELKKIFKTSKDTKELKFSKLKKYHKYHAQIIEFLNHDLINENTVKLSVFHKDYCVWAHTVDRLIEPQMYDDNFDLYKDGANIAFTNLLYLCTPVFCDIAKVELYKKSFIKLFKERDADSINEFYENVKKLIDSCKDDEYANILQPIFTSIEQIGEILHKWDMYNFDSYLSGFMHQIDFWGRTIGKEFTAYVDDNKPLKHFENHLKRVLNYSEEMEIGTDRRTMQLPLKLKNIEFEDSMQNDVVQIADLIAGAANHYFKSLTIKNQDQLAQKIGNTKIESLLDIAVWPHDAVTPSEMDTEYKGGNNILDELAALHFRSNSTQKTKM